MVAVSFTDWPIYFKERLILGNSASDVGIVTLWTPAEQLAQKLSRASFCAMGQLYSKRGINYLLRNILARPSLRQLYVVGQDRTGSGEALLALAARGVERRDGRQQIVGVENGFIDEQIPLSAIEDFRKNVEVIDQRWSARLADSASTPMGWHHNGASALSASPPSSWRQPEIFPEATTSPGETRPSEQTVFTVRRPLISAAWVEILKHVLKFGATQPTLYGGTKKELLNVVAVVEEETAASPIVPAFMGLSPSDVANYIETVFRPERGEEPYTYGERLTLPVNQIDQMVAKLKRYPADVGALATLWQPEVDNFPIRQPWRTPCLTLIQGVVRMDPGSSPGRSEGGRFLMTAYFRSNDVFGAWPLNAWALRHLQAQIAERLNVKIGPLTTISHCAHIYDNALPEAATIVLQNNELACCPDPRGSFVITVSGSEIVVDHLSPAGLAIAQYKQDATVPNAAQLLGNKIVQDLGISQIEHALDLGAQLARAEEAVSHHLSFTQDRPLR